MLGFYDYTVILTYISLLISMGGIMFSVNGYLRISIFCLALSGLCDMFDGKIARSKKDRTADEKRFGVQIDSLCDMVCFGVAPAIICYNLGMHGITGIIILLFYVLAGLIRLAYFNVIEENRQMNTEDHQKYYHGLPITSMAIALPILFMFGRLLGREFILSLHVLVLTIGILFITDFKLKKPKNATLAILVILVSIALLKIFHIG